MIIIPCENADRRHRSIITIIHLLRPVRCHNLVQSATSAQHLEAREPRTVTIKWNDEAMRWAVENQRSRLVLWQRQDRLPLLLVSVTLLRQQCTSQHRQQQQNNQVRFAMQPYCNVQYIFPPFGKNVHTTTQDSHTLLLICKRPKKSVKQFFRTE